MLRGVCLEVRAGQIVALLGANGAGKTTLLRAITGLLDVHDGEITKGAVTLDGDPIHRLRPAAIVAAAIGQVMEGRRIFAELTVEENLRVGGHTNARADEARPRAGLRPVPGARPTGEEHGRLPLRRRAADAGDGAGADGRAHVPAARRAEPRARAPTGGADPRPDRRDQPAGTSVLLVEQNATMALSIAEHGYVHGDTARSCSTSPPTELLADEDIREFYLGLRRGAPSRSGTSSTTSDASGGCHDRAASHRRPDVAEPVSRFDDVHLSFAGVKAIDGV